MNQKNSNITNLNEYNEFYLNKENKIYRIIILRLRNEIVIKYNNYEAKLNCNNIIILLNLKFDNLEDVYYFLVSCFEENKVYIKEIINYTSLKLFLKKEINGEDKNNEIILIYSKNNKSIIINEINNNYIELKNDINNLKAENKKLNDEITKLKSIIFNKDLTFKNKNNSISISEKYEIYDNLKFKSNPKNIRFFKDLAKDSNGHCLLDNTFTVFKSINDILYLIYSNKNNSIISYNLTKCQKVTEIRNAHNKSIINFRHYLDNINRCDYILSISAYDNNLKIWNINNFNCILNLKNVNDSGYIYASCFLNDNNQKYILKSNFNYSNPLPIKVFNFNGKEIKEIKNSDDSIYCIDVYYNKKSSKIYIISGNNQNVKSFDYINNILYNKYEDFEKNNNKAHCSIIINNKKNIIELIESSYDGNIRIWDFHSGLLLKKYKVGKYWLRGICLWNDNYLFVGCDDKSIKLIDINNGKIFKNLIEHEKEILCIKKINHPKFGECLISQGYGEEKINLYITEI